MMNRGKLEAWVVRLYMFHNRNRISKSGKAEALRRMKVHVTKLMESTLIGWVDEYLTDLEVM